MASTPTTAQGSILDADGLADRILRSEELIDDGLAEHADGGGALDVLFREHAAAHDLQFFSVRYSGETPRTVVFQFWLP